MNIYFKKALLSVIPSLVTAVHVILFGKRNKKVLPSKAHLKLPRKPVDTTPISVQQYDYINAARVAWLTYNLDKHGADRKSRLDLVNAVNEVLNLNKSESYFGDIWSNRKKRESCVDVDLTNL